MIQEKGQFPFQRQGGAGIGGYHQQQAVQPGHLGDTARIGTATEWSQGGAGACFVGPGCFFDQFAEHRV